ncbi:MAG: PIG-L deacetylase family protein [Acidobacteriaceae bacterium]
MSKDLLERATASEDRSDPMPRTMLVFAHPDDEVVALGARLGRFSEATFVHVTDGAPKNERDSRAHGFATLNQYREARERELGQALMLAGVEDAGRVRLEIPDQEASFQLPRLTSHIERLLLEHRPEVVFTHPYEGGHPDHDACAFAVHHAISVLRTQGKTTPVILEGAFYHARKSGIELGCFPLSPQGAAEVAYMLSDAERLQKCALLACFATQQQTLSGFPLDFERFRIAPDYDFSQPPNGGSVLYDRFPWGVASTQFCAMAREALEIPCL